MTHEKATGADFKMHGSSNLLNVTSSGLPHNLYVLY